jgi:hypothetical protein
MAEIGLVTFARGALPIGQAVLPAYRSKLSKHQFTQPQLLALLCLMRYADWSFRAAEVRVAEHRELRRRWACIACRITPPCTAFSAGSMRRSWSRP